MTRDRESQVVGFCVAQRERFDAGAWMRFSGDTPMELAAVARYLAGVSWYGRQADLRDVADRLSPLQFAELARKTNFDASRFGGLLKAHLRHSGQPVAA